MIRPHPLRPALLTTAMGLALASSVAVECHAYPFGKHHSQNVVLVPTAQPAVVAQAPAVVSYAPVATQAVTTMNAPVNPIVVTTGSAPVATMTTTAAAPALTGAAPTAGYTLYING